MTEHQYGVVSGRIPAGALRAGRVHFDPAELDPIARAQWDQLGRRFALLTEFEERHPLLHRLRRWPVLGGAYQWALRRYVLAREPQLPAAAP